VVRRRVDLAELLLRLGIADTLLEQVRVADDRVHRRADLVAHVGEEGALRQVGRFCLGLRLRERGVRGRELGGALPHALLELGLLARQLLRGEPLRGDGAEVEREIAIFPSASSWLVAACSTISS
jgi:hypothetical protein